MLVFVAISHLMFHQSNGAKWSTFFRVRVGVGSVEFTSGFIVHILSIASFARVTGSRRNQAIAKASMACVVVLVGVILRGSRFPFFFWYFDRPTSSGKVSGDHEMREEIYSLDQ